MRKFLLTIISTLVVCNVFASPKIYVFHINGVNTKYSDALNNADQLQKLANISSNMLSNSGRFDLLYNSDESGSFCSLCNQVGDVLHQKKLEYKDVTVDDFVTAYMKTYNLHYESGGTDYEILKIGIKDDYLKDKTFVGANLDDIYNQYNTKTQQSMKFGGVLNFLSNVTNNEGGTKPYVLLLPHSQGNLYANELYEYAISTGAVTPDHIAIYGIANPASKMDGVINPESSPDGNVSDSAHYTTADNDFVIHSLSVFSMINPISNSPMPANIHLNTCNDLLELCHGLVDAYLADSTVSMQIAKQINLFLIALKHKIATSLEIRLAVGPYGVTYAGVPTTVVTPSQTVLCDNKACDSNVMGYFKSNKYFKYDSFQWFYLGFKDKIAMGHYFITVESGNGNERIFGNITNVLQYDVDTDYSVYPFTYSLISLPQTPFQFPIGVNSYFIVGLTPEENIKKQLPPSAYVNGQFIYGSFDVN